LYFVLDFLFVFCLTRLCAFIRLFLYYSFIQLISCKCVFIKLLCSSVFEFGVRQKADRLKTVYLT